MTTSKEKKPRANRQPYSVDVDFIVRYLEIPAKMTSYSNALAGGHRVLVFFKPEPTEETNFKLKSGIEYHKMSVNYRYGDYRLPPAQRVIKVDCIEPELVLLCEYLKDPPKTRPFRSPIRVGFSTRKTP